jgi:hypothetical protein
MMNLRNLKTICDVSLRVYSETSGVDIEFSESKAQEVKSLVETLETLGIRCVNVYSSSLAVQNNNYNGFELAEQIAMDLEETGLKVRRLIPTPGAYDLSPNMAVKSFLKNETSI